MTTEHTDTISELFARDPLEWTDEMIDRMIAHLREQRLAFLAKPVKEKASKEPAMTKEQAAALGTEDLLASLGL